MNRFLARLTGRQTEEVETRQRSERHLPQEWRPAGGDMIPHPGPQVERVIQRVKVDRNVTVYEQEVVYLSGPKSAAIRELCSGGPRFVEHDGSPASPERIAQYYAGEFDVINTAPDVPRQAWE